MAAASTTPPPAAAPPKYTTTIGGPGHAEIYPSGLDVDSAGNVYVADTGNDQVRAYSPTGALLWTTGGRRSKTLGFFMNPRDLAYHEGKVYVGDTGYNRIQILDAGSGAPLDEWGGFGSIMGVSAGVAEDGDPLILITQDNRHLTALYKPNGSLVRWIGTGPGSGNGELNGPRDAATDSNGNVYVADFLNNRIVKFTATGEWLFAWGGTGTSDGKFQRPYGVAVDEADNVYVADSNNSRIQKFTASGTFLAKWGTKGTGPGQFSHLRRVALGGGPEPDLYGADLWGTKIEKIDQDGTHEQSFGGVGFPDGLFNEPAGFSVDSGFFVVDSVNQRIQRLGSAGAFELAFGHRGWGSDLLGFGWPRDITANAALGTVWLADTRNNKLKEFTRDGVPTGRTLGAFGTEVGKLSSPWGLASYGEDLIVANTNNNRVERWSPAAGSALWSRTGLKSPRDVAVSGDVVYVADTLNKQVVRLRASDGGVVDVFGGTSLHLPSGVAVEGDGEVWVSDSNWNRMVKFAADGTFREAFGGFGTSHGKFNNPTRVEIRDGRLYVADEWNDRIEVFELR